MRRPLVLTIVLALACAATALAALPQQNGEVDLATGANGELKGGGQSNALTGVLAGAGDVNGDGQSDLAVLTATGGGTVADVVFNPGGVMAASGGVPNGFRITAPGASLTSVARAGDVNGDRLSDLIVGASAADGDRGRAWVVFGKAATTPVDLGVANFGGYAITTSEATARLGAAVGGGGDVNGDGLSDVIAGAPGANGTRGAAYVVFGRTTQNPADTQALAAGGIRIDGDGAQQALAGANVAILGDSTGDGKAEFAVGAPQWDVNSATDAGTVFVFHGRAIAGATTLSVSNLPPGPNSDGFRIEGPAAGAALSPVTTAGDVNGDGKAEIAVGAPFDPRVAPQSGSVSVVFGKADGAPVALAQLGDKGRTYTNNGGEQLGTDVRGAFDVNGDGVPDIVAGAPGADPKGLVNAGRAYVLFGRTGTAPVSTTELGSAGIRINGTRGEQTGASAQQGSRIGNAGGLGMGDVNSDGRTDVLIGAAAATLSGGSSFDPGHAWTVLGFGTPEFTYPGTLTATRNVAFPGAGPSGVRRTGQATFAVSPALPAGLALEEGSGRITGTPTVYGTSTHTLTMTDLAGSVAKAIKLEISPGRDVDPPVLSKAKLTRRKFRVGKRPTALAGASATGFGTSLRFTVSEPVTARIAIACTGRIAKARRKACKRLKTRGTFRRTLSAAGEAVFAFTGRVGKTPLKPGRYTMTLRATDKAGLNSNAIVLRFTVVTK